MDKLSFLAKKNKHERDLNITFDAGPHVYFIKDMEDQQFLSVTKWNHSHFAEFDADAIIVNMMKGKGWSKSKYFGKTPEEIKAEWNKGRDEAASAGTNLHYQIECYYNCVEGQNGIEEQYGIEENSIEYSIEYSYFKNFVAACPGLKPYRTEWMIYHEDLLLAGSIDMVFENEEDGTLMIYDWKRAKDIVKTTSFMKYSTTECISHIPDTNFWHYALQLNTYKTILEQKYGKIVTKLCLVCLHPNKSNFQVIPVPILKDEMESLFDLRKKQLYIR